ncbi:MAG: hypothetical protein B7X39_18740 [Lysobacterales bacterium 14-68-21]|jgi:hypothetical protein|nr:MAG: hypothetical protein B7X45_16685 [Xanthomonadales bacterium 15-68-25]OZB63713.1 MAG: hypothetical protein B7X39_18740 [Xanthomonadales bacterium 14-68-21]
MNKESKTDYNRIIRDPEPSAIEFQDTFRGIVEETIKAERRLIIVIDNLDRLPGEEALAMWATIRSLFLGSDTGLHQRRTRYDPIIILPIAEEALARMYKGGEGATLARSFMDKTFDLTFRVNRLVLTKWYEYLSAQMSKVFNTEFQPSWAFVTGRLYDRYCTAGNGTTITPRSINTLINSTAALWMLWRGKVEFASVAYYCIWRDAIDVNVVQALSTPNAIIREHDENWQASVAAIHYGVSPEEASGVLLELPLKRAIANREYDEFSRMANIAGFGFILHKAVEDGGARTDSKSVFNTSLLLGRLEAGGGSELHAETWRLLRAQIASVEEAFDFGMDEAEALGLLYSSCPASRKAAFLRDCEQLLQRALPNTVTKAEFQKAFVHFWGNVGREDNVQNLLPEVIYVPGDANALCLIASQFSITSEIFRRLDSRIDNPAISQYIVSLLQGSTNGEMTETRISTLMALRRKFEWSDSFDQILGIVRTANVNLESLRAALFVVVSVALKRKKLDDVVALVADGSFGGRLNEAYNAKNEIVMGRILGLHLLSTKEISLPNAPEWPQMLKDRDLFRNELNATLRKFDAAGWNVVTTLVSSQRVTPSIHSLVALVASEWIESGFMSRVNVEGAIGDLPSYLSLMNSDELKQKFVIRLASFKEFWEVMQAKKLEGNVSDIFEVLLDEPSTSGKAKEELRKHLAEDSLESWEGWLANGGKPLSLALRSKTVQGEGLEPKWLYDALEKTIPQILASTDLGLIQRWFAVAGLSNDKSLGMLYKRMRDLIAVGTNVSSLLSVISEGGVQLIERGHFSDRADDMVRYVIVPLVDKKEGLTLLAKLKDSFLASVEACEPSTREFVGDRLNQSASSEDQEMADGGRLLLEAWGIPLVPQVSSEGQTEDSPA